MNKNNSKEELKIDDKEAKILRKELPKNYGRIKARIKPKIFFQNLIIQKQKKKKLQIT